MQDKIKSRPAPAQKPFRTTRFMRNEIGRAGEHERGFPFQTFPCQGASPPTPPGSVSTLHPDQRPALDPFPGASPPVAAAPAGLAYNSHYTE